MVNYIQKISIPNLILLLFVFILVLKFVWTLIEDVYQNYTDSNSLKNEKLVPFSRSKDSATELKKAELLHRAEFWQCDACGTEFQLASGSIPNICPSCGETLVGETIVDEEAVPYICPQCGPYVMLDGDDSSVCPICGSEEVQEVNWAIRCSERWICSECSQEFTAPSRPSKCPHCESQFTAGEDYLEDSDGTLKRCPSCLEEFLVWDGDDVKYCPSCKKKLN